MTESNGPTFRPVRLRLAETTGRRRRPPAVAAVALVTALALAVATDAALPQEGRTFDDPFAYCASVRTVDIPDARYTGPAVPEAIALGLKDAFGAPTDASLELFRENTYWRCMNGEVYACTVGANLPCTEKADASRTPRPPSIEYCRESPGAGFIPAVVTGRATVYRWRCEGTEPVAVKRVMEVDARGFLADVWYRIEPRPR